MPLLGLDLLELLADSINFVLHYESYKNEGTVVRGAFAEGCVYLTNLKVMSDRAKEIIEECKMRKNGRITWHNEFHC